MTELAGPVPVYGGTREIPEWVAAGGPLEPGSVDGWARLSPQMVQQWRADLNHGLDITQVPRTLTTVAFFWDCGSGHVWRETPYLRTDSSGKTPRWKSVAGTRAACRECTVEQHGPRYDCGCLDRNLSAVGRTFPVSTVCPTCDGYVDHQWPCGRRTRMRSADRPPPDQRCPWCRKAWEKLDRDPALAARVSALAVNGLPVGHERVQFWCGVGHHPPFEQDLAGIVGGYGCTLCFKTSFTPGGGVEPGRVFRTRSSSPTSAVETKLRQALSERFKLAQVKDANAVRIAGDFYGFKHVLPDILLPQLRIAVELDSPGRDGLWHRGELADRDRLKDQLLANVGWRVIRVRIDGLGAVDHAESVVAATLTKAVVAQVVELIEQHASDHVPGR